MKLQRMRNLAAAIFALTACLLPLLVHADEHNHVVRLYTILVSFSFSPSLTQTALYALT